MWREKREARTDSREHPSSRRDRPPLVVVSAPCQTTREPLCFPASLLSSTTRLIFGSLFDSLATGLDGWSVPNAGPFFFLGSRGKGHGVVDPVSSVNM